MPTVLVINPYVADFKLYDEWMHPLGLYFLISLLKDNGIDVHFFNCLERDDNQKAKKYGVAAFPYREIEKPPLYRSIPRKYKLYGRPQKELLAFLENVPRPDCICVGSMMTYWLPGVTETISVIRSVYRDIPLLVGGIAARLMPQALKKIPGVSVGGTLSDGKAIRLCDAIPPLRADRTPTLLGGLKMMEKAYHGPALVSLGCPLSCSFCASRLLQGTFRRRPKEVVIEEIVYCAERFGARDFAFYDDALLYEPDLGILPLLSKLAARNYSLRFHSPNGLHARYIDEKMADALRGAGFTTLRLGFESGAKIYSRDTGGKASRGELRKKIVLLRKAGFGGNEIGVYVMAGLEGQRPSCVAEEIGFVASLGVKAKPVYLSPVPGTLLFERYAGRFPQIRGDPLWHNDSFFVTQVDGWNWETVEMIRATAKTANAFRRDGNVPPVSSS